MTPPLPFDAPVAPPPPEPLCPEPHATPTGHAGHPASWPLAVAGPRPNPPLDRRDLAAWLDSIDDALLVLNIDGLVVQANASAQQRLAQLPWLARVHGPHPSWRVTSVATPLQDAIRLAVAQGRHKLLRLPDGGAMAAVQPLAGRPDLALLSLGRSQYCAPLTLQFFAQAHQLSPAEQGVLGKLLQGQRPADIARDHGVLMSTVRTQISSLRAKTGEPSILALVQAVGMLPAMCPQHAAAVRPPVRPASGQ